MSEVDCSGSNVKIIGRDGNRSSDGLFTHYSWANPYTAINSPDGYTKYSYDAYYLEYTESSLLVFMVNHLQFTPAYIAYYENPSYYYQDVRLNKGYCSVVGSSFSSSSPHGQSGSITAKGYRPASSQISTTISSTYGVSLSGELSNGLETGVVLGDDIGVSITRSMSTITGITLSYSSSSSSSFVDPLLSTQLLGNSNGASLYYEVSNVNVAGKLTFQVDFIVVFEIENGELNSFGAAFKADVDIWTKCKWYDSNFFSPGWKDGTEYTYHLTDWVGFHV